MKTTIENQITSEQLDEINYTIEDLKECDTLGAVKALFSMTMYRGSLILEFGWGANHAFVSDKKGNRILFITE